MLILFPFIYFLSFVWASKEILKGDKSGMLLFFIFGLSIYTVSQSLAFELGLRSIISFMQPLKELLVMVVFGIAVWNYKGKFKLHFVDYIIGAFFLYIVSYVFIPIGDYSFLERLNASKSIAFFAVIYATGRLFKPQEIFLSKYFHYILFVAVAAAIVLAYELVTNTHLQTMTGYADFNFYLYDQEPSGNYGLTWTFETENGFKRFASFFANPLEHAAATLLALSVLAGLYTSDSNKLKLDLFGKIALLATQFSVFFALSRASMVSYFAMIYVYALVTGKKYILHAFHFGLIAIVIYFIFLITNTDIYDFVVDTLTFRNASSLGHVLEWVAGIEAMFNKPLGLGLGSSGKVSGMLGLNVGGENQFIIIGVQAGFIAFFVYLLIQVSLIWLPFRWINRLKGKERKIAISLFLLKIGSIIPLLTADFESYIYIAYIGWFLSGLFISIISRKAKPERKLEDAKN